MINLKTFQREFLKVPYHLRPRSTSSPKSCHSPFSNFESRKKSGHLQSNPSKRRSLPRLPDRCHFTMKHFWVAVLARIMCREGNQKTSAISSLTKNDIRICKSGLKALLKCETCRPAFRQEFEALRILCPRTRWSSEVRERPLLKSSHLFLNSEKGISKKRAFK